MEWLRLRRLCVSHSHTRLWMVQPLLLIKDLKSESSILTVPGKGAFIFFFLKQEPEVIVICTMVLVLAISDATPFVIAPVQTKGLNRLELIVCY